MSHPKDRRERFLIAQRKGFKRIATWHFDRDKIKDAEIRERVARSLRETTKRCGGSCCTNPRHNGWGKSGNRFTLQEQKFNEACCF